MTTYAGGRIFIDDGAEDLEEWIRSDRKITMNHLSPAEIEELFNTSVDASQIIGNARKTHGLEKFPKFNQLYGKLFNVFYFKKITELYSKLYYLNNIFGRVPYKYVGVQDDYYSWGIIIDDIKCIVSITQGSILSVSCNKDVNPDKVIPILEKLTEMVYDTGVPSPCCCGCPIVENVNEFFSGRPDQCYQIRCTVCGISGPSVLTEDKAISYWNQMISYINKGKQNE